MYAVFEVGLEENKIKGEDSIICIDTNIQSISWMKNTTNILSDVNEGWLATGNSNSMIGCTFTSCLSEKKDEFLKRKEKQSNIKIEASHNLWTTNNILSTSNTQNVLNRTNFNLRGHKNDIKLVRWNEPYQKLATCDSKGVIYVWVKYEGRWSIELINDRGNSVSDFAWSHDGKMAVICYLDGFVLVGSVNGQRFWSNMYDLPNLTISCVTWAPNDNFVLIGLSNGHLICIDENGIILTRHYLKDDSLIDVQYNAPKFFTSHHDLNKQHQNENFAQLNRNSFSLSINQNEHVSTNNNTDTRTSNNYKNKNVKNSDYMLACLFKTNCNIYLLNTYDDLDPVVIDTKLDGVKFEWSNCGKFLSVGGFEYLNRSSDNKLNNFVHFYNLKGVLIYRIKVPLITNENILNSNRLENKLIKQHKKSKTEVQQKFSCLTWGHNDQRIFIACSSTLHILRIYKEIPKLSLLNQISLKSFFKESYRIEGLNLPNRLKEEIEYLNMSTIKSNYPKFNNLRNFSCSSLPLNERLHCTLKCSNIDNKNNKDYFVLYLEYLGGLIPLLTARRSSKLKPNFSIFDPSLSKITQNNSVNLDSKNYKIRKISRLNFRNSFKENINQDSSKKKNEIKRRSIKKNKLFKTIENNKYKIISKKRVLVEIKSNIWGTKFEFLGNNFLPDSIGKIIYKTSLFHLQPRQMKIVLNDLTNSIPIISSKKDLTKKINKSSILDLNQNKLSENLVSSRQLASATLGAIPSNHYFDENTIKTKKMDSLNEKFFNDFTNCNEKIATIQQLIENKFDKNDNFFNQKNFNLPILSLASNINKCEFENEYLFTSITDNDELILDNQTDQKIKNYNQKKKSLFNALKREILFTSSNSSNFFRNTPSINKNFIEYDYEKFSDSNSRSIKIKSNNNHVNEICSNFRTERLTIDKVKNKNSRYNKQFILHNKPPIWNETNQVYQLDFGGRVTQESAKNFQIELSGKQVMQFGRIDSNAYTLDFEWPFTAVQAFSIALANITQRFK